MVDGKPITEVELQGSYANRDKVKEEFLVRVEWLKTVSMNEAIKEKGFFGNQNSAAKPKAKIWQHTVERLKKRFSVE